MKKCVFIILFLPVVVLSQYDFETRYFTINSSSLPEVEETSSFGLEFGETPKFFKEKTISDFNKVTVENYREAVDMAQALNESQNFVREEFDVEKLQSKFYAFGDNAAYTSDGKTRVKNTVYREQRGLSLLDPCPPFGICHRCAPYRVGRGF